MNTEIGEASSSARKIHANLRIKTKNGRRKWSLLVVGRAGLEPARLFRARDFKSLVATGYTTCPLIESIRSTGYSAQLLHVTE